MKDMKQVRLDILVKNFRNVPNVKKAFTDLKNLIEEEDDKELKRLLRDHRKRPIKTDEEVDRRDNIDFLLGFYSLVQIGLVADYLPLKLNPKLVSEIKMILENKSVKDYYKQFYKLYLPQLLSRHIKALEKGQTKTYPGNTGNEEKAAVLFEKFLLLYKMRIGDSDIDQFLWFLDDGLTYDPKMDDDADITDLMKVLSDPEQKDNLLSYQSPKISPLEKSIYGFARYINWLHDFRQFLKECEKIPVLHSSCWHIESYWFDHLDHQMGTRLKKAVANVQKCAAVGQRIEDEDEDKKIKKQLAQEWKKESSKAVKEALKDIDYLFKPTHGKIVKDLVRKW